VAKSLADKAKSLAGSRRADVHGWIYLRVEGSPYERGFQHGCHCAAELRAALRSIRYLIYQDTGIEFDWFARNAHAMYADMLSGNWGGKLPDNFGKQILDELQGIVDGANQARKPREAEVTLADLIGWNAYPEMICQWFPAVMGGQIKPAVPIPKVREPNELVALVSQPRRWHHFSHSCSAFIASGKWTADGALVAAQTTWQRFANGDAYNIILDLNPDVGERMVMQSVPGYVYSSTDFCVTGGGLVVAETSLDVNGFDPKGLPDFLRTRRACQFARSIPDWCKLFRLGNNGGYVNTWLLGEVNSGKIAAYELTLSHEQLQPVVRSGYYASCNMPLSVPIRNLDSSGASAWDNVLKSGARRVRFDQLLAKHKGKIDAAVAQAILADHGDVYLNTEFPCGRTICGHFDNDDQRYGGGGHGPWYPWGSLDGKVTTGALAGEQKLRARWGRACGTPLDVERFFRERPQYDWLRGYMLDRPTQPWAEFPGDF
jgi:hypothetical protein